MRVASLHAAGRDAAAVASSMRDKLSAFRPSALLWATDAPEPSFVAEAMAEGAPASVGGVSRAGLIGGGEEWAPHGGEVRAIALAIGLPEGASALPWHSSAESLPDLPGEAWARCVAAPPEDSPHLLLLAAPPRHGTFPLERWLGMLDTALPWARKVGGLTASGDGRLFVGATQHDGGAVGLALEGVEMDAHSFQGAVPIGPSFEITSCEGNIIRGLDGCSIGETVGDLIESYAASHGEESHLSVGISVPGRAAAASPLAASVPSSLYVVRACPMAGLEPQ